MGSLGAPELIIIGVVLLLLFGASRLPATAQGLGKALKMFKKEVRDEDKDGAPAEAEPQRVTTPPQQVTASASEQPAQPAPQAQAQPVQQPAEEPRRTES